MRRIRAVAAILVALSACSQDRGLTEPVLELSSGKAGGRSEGQATWIYSANGNVASANPATATAKANAPFGKLSLAGFELILSESGPTGNIDACRTGTGSYATDFGYYAGQVITGTLQIKDATTGMIAFLGSNAEGHTVQFNIGDSTGGVVQSVQHGVYTYTYTDARMYFGGNTTVTDGMYRCVNMTLTATPAS